MTVRTDNVRQNPAYRLRIYLNWPLAESPQEASYLVTMTSRQVFAFSLSAMLELIMACTRAPSIESPDPVPVPVRGDSTAHGLVLRLPQHNTRYSLRQTSSVQNLRAQDSATSGNITTTAILDFVIDSVDGSGHLSFTITADSLRITTEGSIPSHRVVPLRIGPVIRGSVANGRIMAATALPDSLCAYSHLLTAAFHLLLPQLPAEVSLPLSKPVADTIAVTSCRAGTRIQLQMYRQVHSPKQAALTLGLNEKVKLSGAGMLRRDSIVISGLMTTTGDIVFEPDSRLPQLIQTQSDGRITVRLADSTTAFEQRSTQQLQRQP